MDKIDYGALKQRGFLRQKQEGFFILRTRKHAGNYDKKDLLLLAEISEKYGRGITHATTRQGIEIPFIKFEHIDEIEEIIKNSGMETGASGSRLRTTTCCPGNNWCKSGLVNTFYISERIEKDLGLKCGLSLPHKFKIAISGCPNTCTRAQASEIGIHGDVDTNSRKIGYSVYLGGCGGRTPHEGFKLEKILNEDQVLEIVKNVIGFYKENAKPRQRLALLIKEIGRERFLEEINFK